MQDRVLEQRGFHSNLKQVPCKFHFGANTVCSAGDACTFSHEKPVGVVCEWWRRGSCRFGHKCSLLHIAPGEPASADKANKRAQRLAERQLSDRHGDRAAVAASVRLPLDGPASIGPPPTQEHRAVLHAPASGAIDALRVGPIPTGIVRPVAVNGRRPREAVIDNGIGAPSPFGTSPFSPPTTAVFFSGSDVGSPSIRRRPMGSDDEPTNDVGGSCTPHLYCAALGSASDEEHDPLIDSRHAEDLLPSSLDQLLTPDELARRQRIFLSRHLHDAGGSLSQSVPHDAHHGMADPPGGATDPSLDRASVRTSPSGETPPPASGSALLSAHHQPGTSLPPGLAAGLSRLHMQSTQPWDHSPSRAPRPSHRSSPEGAAMRGDRQMRWVTNDTGPSTASVAEAGEEMFFELEV